MTLTPPRTLARTARPFSFRAARPLAAALTLGLAAGLIAAGPLAPAAQAQTGSGGGAPEAFAPAAFVNGRAVTNFDVAQRMALLAVANVGGDREQALESVIDDQLKRQAARDAGIEIPAEDIEQALGRFARAQGLDTPQALERRLDRAGVAPSVVREFLETELMWSSLVRRDYMAGTEVSDAEVDAEIEAQSLNAEVSYVLAELVVPAGPDPDAARARVQEMVQQVRAGADFAQMARSNSASRTAQRGGRVGEVQAAQLPGPLAAILAQVPEGGVTDALPTQGAVVALQVIERRETAREITDEMRENVRAGILERRLARKAEGRLQELRARAYVERR